jgi:hypothetical protein
MMATDRTTDSQITKSDIEGKLRELRGEVDSSAATARPVIMGVAAVAAVGVIAVVFLLGRRQGKRKNTVVEVRRL